MPSREVPFTEEKQGFRVLDRRETRSRRGHRARPAGRWGKYSPSVFLSPWDRSEEERSRNLGSQRLNLRILCLPRWKIASTAAFVGVWDRSLG